MGERLQNRIKVWKELLLDLSKRNRLINFIEGKRSNVKITVPSFDELYNKVVSNEEEIVFPYAKKTSIDDNGEESYEEFVDSGIETTKTIGELQKTLKALRYKANTSIEERGVNILFLAFGLLKYKEIENSSKICAAPIVLVPVRLTIESLSSPYKLSITDDEVVVNPTLIQKLNNDFGISLPEFDSTNDDIDGYLDEIEAVVHKNGWEIDRCVHLTILQFLKINMYKDLDAHEDKLCSNPIIRAIAGEGGTELAISDNLKDYNHDKNTKPINTFQVVDADSSQQDAILLSKLGKSFVLQGPPGTGKSQTITNIISEALADGKKVLFVSEKKAALQVVYNRLSKVGLSDFCFALHSDKAKKKDILQALSNSININRNRRVREEALLQLDELEKKRDVLNQYQAELHTSASGLNLSIFDVNGKLAKLDDAPDISFAIADIESITTQQLNERIYTLRQLAETIGKRTETYTNNAWRDSTIKSISNAIRHDIDANIANIIPKLETLGNGNESICSKLGIDKILSMQGTTELIKLLQFIGESPSIPTGWIFNNDAGLLITNAKKYQERTDYINKTTLELSNKYKPSYFNEDILSIKQTLCSSMHDLHENINIQDDDCLAYEIESIYRESVATIEILNRLFDKATALSGSLGLAQPDDINQLYTFANTTHALSQIYDVTPTEDWFCIETLKQIKSDIDMHESLHASIIRLKAELLQKFDIEILSCDYYPILQRFRGEYISAFRIFKGAYRRDMRLIKSYLSNGGKLSYTETINTLNTLKTLSDKMRVVSDNDNLYKKYYGSYYYGVDTNWALIKSSIAAFEQVLNELHTIPQSLQSLIIKKALPISEIEQFNTIYAESDAGNKYASILSKLKYASYNSYREFADNVNGISANALKFLTAYNKLLDMRNEKCKYSELISEANLAISLSDARLELNNQKEAIQKLYGSYYSGEYTDWDKLLSALNYANTLKHLAVNYKLPDTVIQSICENDDLVSYCRTMSTNIANYYNAVKSGIDWFASLFERQEEFYCLNIFDLVNRMQTCKDKKYLLEEWVDYCDIKQKCEEIGIAAYTPLVESHNLSGENVVRAYLKRFYRLWLDAILPKFPAVENFRSRNQTQTIDDFRKLDKKQFDIARARVRERILSRMPDFNAITSATDEVGILRRELGKQRRLMPLRKLFATIPNLITTLRPCFMMSPLSVSVFLDAGNYDFDLVIFDEASQVHTEDAIGAIMRGKQSIIVGDTKQLPPTNFFTASLNDDEYDIDTNDSLKDDDAGSYDSILDEAVAVLPEKSLRWHYRSKNEDLITFSNRKIYQGNLITFPSAIADSPDWGVEYIYVADGVYDRSGKRCNMAEAKRVADLVFEHFTKYPQRSLGVVTFSEAQQDAIDGIIRQKRRENNRMEKFFKEEADEPFFIKNLETVQGDERDTIIFSIGYAKDSKGVMYMNFGPLSRDGGYRRLNVAITRAKYNIKLVGSITATDINLEKTSAEGVRMLRSYIEFAQQGVSALNNEITVDDERDCDSPFEESVLLFLQSKGYKVSKQVGCSGFRIDLAVQHPTLNGKFVIGIECDGATYHSARTARERDRLRQTILEDMGWTIYRIWSTDWIKSPATEKEKLIVAIESALSTTSNVAIHNNKVEPPIEDIEEIIQTEEIRKQDLGFVEYCRADINKLLDTSLENAIREVIRIEQPISLDELCHRIAPKFNRQKATSVVQYNVLDLLTKMNDIVYGNDGFVKYRDFIDIKVRYVKTDNGVRPIDDICDDELTLAMIAVSKNSIGPTVENFIFSVARTLGYTRVSERTTTKLQEIYDSAIQNGKLREEDDKVYYVKE